ncbi:MAG: hypothetical protein AB1700_19620, partial [Bacillota bacterium]
MDTRADLPCRPVPVFADPDTSYGYPAVSLTGDEELCLVAQGYHRGRDSLHFRLYDQRRRIWTQPKCLCGLPDCYKPRIARDSDGVIHAVWPVVRGDSWNIFYQTFLRGQWSQARPVASGYTSDAAVACGAGNETWVAWSMLSQQPTIAIRRLVGGRWDDPIEVKDSCMLFRPAIVS